MKLGDLDELLVPRWAAWLQRRVNATIERRVRGADSIRRVASAVVNPAPTNPLRRLDQRYASRGPLGLLRDVPQLGFLVVAAVFLAGAGVALAQSGSRHAVPTARERAVATVPTSLGPAPGTNIAAYIAATRKRAVLVASASPDRIYVALVTFSRYMTPEQARLLLGELEVKKVLAHVPLPSAEVLQIPITASLVQDVQTTFAEISKRKLRDRKEFTNLALSITGASREEQQYKSFYLDAGRTAGQEASAYAKGCACVFGALLRGKAAELAALPALAGIRAVDIAGSDDDTLQLAPLLPEQTVTVTRPLTPGQGNGA